MEIRTVRKIYYSCGDLTFCLANVFVRMFKMDD